MPQPLRSWSDRALEDSIWAFLELGNTRNRLVHLNYVNFDIDKSPQDIMALFRSALERAPC
jgi:hypothetical protein